MEADQVYAIRLPDGGVLELRDLPPRTLQEIADKNGTNWMVVLDAPLSNVGVAVDLLATVADLHGVKFPEPLRARDLITLCADWFVIVPKDTETEDVPDVAWSA